MIHHISFYPDSGLVKALGGELPASFDGVIRDCGLFKGRRGVLPGRILRVMVGASQLNHGMQHESTFSS